MAHATYRLIGFEQLDSWARDDFNEALNVYRRTSVAEDVENARQFFESRFQPVLVTDGQPMLFTGYFEPELKGSAVKTEQFRYPLYRLPPDWSDSAPFLTRQEIETTDALSDRGLEIAWLADPLDLFFLQVQGSGRIRLQDGQTIRAGFAGKNGHPYTSIGQEMVRRGALAADAVTPDTIRDWFQQNPDDGRALLWMNQSYVFFRTLTNLPEDQGPIGAMGQPVTPLRSLAVDPEFTPLGLPVWIEKAGESPLHRLMIAQDTGSAIKGAQRADIFFGHGVEAGRAAGQVKDGGRMVVLFPKTHPLLEQAR